MRINFCQLLCYNMTKTCKHRDIENAAASTPLISTPLLTFFRPAFYSKSILYSTGIHFTNTKKVISTPMYTTALSTAAKSIHTSSLNYAVTLLVQTFPNCRQPPLSFPYTLPHIFPVLHHTVCTRKTHRTCIQNTSRRALYL